MATMYDVPLHSVDDSYEMVNDDTLGDSEYPSLGAPPEQDWVLVDTDDYLCVTKSNLTGNSETGSQI